MLHRSLARTCLALAVAMLGCGGAGDATEKHLAEIRSDLIKLRAENAALAQRLDALEIRQGGALRSRGGPPASGEVPPSDRPPLEVVRVTPDEGLDASEPRPVLRSTGRGEVVEEPALGRGNEGDAQREYDRALELHRASAHDEAIEAFSKFLKRWPRHPNAGDAVFWRGESYLAKGEHRRAVEQFEAVVAAHPKGAKAPDALLELATTYARLGNAAKAEKAKKKLLSTYPASEAAKKLADGSTAKP